LVYPASVTGCDRRYSPLARQFPLLETADLPADFHIIMFPLADVSLAGLWSALGSFYVFSSSKSVSNAPKFEYVL